jgi:hypothetical protein
MSYQNAPATKMLATNCVCCGLPLVDAKSVELGIGPDCRKNANIPEDIEDDVRIMANKYVHEAAIAAQKGAVAKVLNYADKLTNLGLEALGMKVARRFKDGAKKASRKADIVITERGDTLIVKTPYRRGDADAFVRAWRDINGRRYDRNTRCNHIPKSEKGALWELLQRFFPGKWGRGPKGAFKVPAQSKTEQVVDIDSQPELDWELDANAD